jgi:hypothetical protein
MRLPYEEEWLNSRGSELKDVGRIIGIPLFVELPGVESEEKQTQGIT